MLLSIIRRMKNKNSDEDFNVDEGVNYASLELYIVYFLIKEPQHRNLHPK
jgi:hypothetical protein